MKLSLSQLSKEQIRHIYMGIECILFIAVTVTGFVTHTLGAMPIVFLILALGHIYWTARLFMLVHAVLVTLLYTAAYLINPDIIFTHTDTMSFVMGMVVFYMGCGGVAVYGQILTKSRLEFHNEKRRLSKLLYSTEEQKRQLEAASIGKTTFFADLSHDIRTSVNTVCGMSELLAQQQHLQGLEKEYVDTLQTASHTLLNTISDILDYSEIDTGKVEFLHVKYNLFSCFREIQNTMLLQIGSKDIAFPIHINPSMPYQFYGDETRIRQILMIMLNNSLHFTRVGQIALDVDYEKIDEESGNILIKISDSGCGIPEDKQDILFEDFDLTDTGSNQLNPSFSLMMAKKLSLLMGGDLKLEHSDSRGTVFLFTLKQQICTGYPLPESASYENCRALVFEPNAYYSIAAKRLFNDLDIHYCFYDTPEALLANAKDEEGIYIIYDDADGGKVLNQSLSRFTHAQPVALVPIQNSPDMTESGRICYVHKPLSLFSLVPLLDKKTSRHVPQKKKPLNNFIAPEARILIVDDNRVNLRVAQGLIATFQCDITTVTNGREAIHQIESGEIYDLIFMDHMMPELDGIETTRMIRDIPTPYARQVPIIALTANTIHGAREMFMENAMNDFIAKPIEMSRLNEIMAEFIDDAKQIPVE